MGVEFYLSYIILITEWLYLKNALAYRISNCDKHDRMHLFTKYKKILHRGLRATLPFRKCKVAVNTLYRIVFKHCKIKATSYHFILSQFDNRKMGLTQLVVEL